MEAFVTEKSKDYSLLDNRTGEIKEFRRTRKISIPEFMMVYFASYSDMFVLTGVQIKVLMCCWRHSTYNDRLCNEGNMIYNDLMFKEACKKDGLKSPNAVIDNAISQLTKYGFLIKKCKGAYLLNPKYFFKGTLSDRTKLQYNLMVEPEEKQIQEDLSKMNEQLIQQNQ